MRRALEFLKSNLWLLPSMIVFCCVLAAVVLIEVDTRTNPRDIFENWHWLLGAGASGARAMLSTIAGSAITVAGVVFSITIVVLSLASSQYSPRVLRNFMGDYKSQAVLGGFLGIFAYCLVVLRSVRGEDHDAFVPSFAVLTSLALALVGIGLLIYYIHHVASSIRATSIISSVYKETVDAIDAIYPKSIIEDDDAGLPEVAKSPDEKTFAVPSLITGYLQRVDLDEIRDVAVQNNITIRMEIPIGNFVIEGNPLAWTSKDVTADACCRIRSACAIGSDRTLEQDVSFGIRQLVDVGLKGLSPGINDTTSANFCIDYLGAVITRLADRPISPKLIKDGSVIKVVDTGPVFEDFLCTAFDQLRQNAENNPAVLLRILGALKSVLNRTSKPSRIKSIANQISFVREVVDAGIPRRDRQKLDTELGALEMMLQQKA